MDLRVYSVDGRTLGRLVLDRDVTQQDIVRSMRKGQLHLAPFEQAKSKPAGGKGGGDGAAAGGDAEGGQGGPVDPAGASGSGAGVRRGGR